MTENAGNVELLAPAGDCAALEAALAAGASAVYLGLTTLNARRRARNFRQDELAHAVQTAHQRGARAYLTLNIDLTQRELGQAARILELARQCQVDAVLVRDPALLSLRKHFPELEFHFSTQTCMTSSADVSAAAQLGARRVVLARELSLREIAAASAVPGVQTEVFVQGALCFCVSGRCLLSSWAGGRSGNRGACTSPCRVPWTVNDQPVGTPLSMRDLATVHRLEDLSRAGVAALKIEGRLKSPAWVGQAVTLYRRALAGESGSELLQQAAGLGAYTGRLLTCGYLDGQRNELTAVAAGRVGAASDAGTEVGGRVGLPPEIPAGTLSCRAADSPPIPARQEPRPPDESGLETHQPDAPLVDTSDEENGAGRYALDVTIGPKGITCRCQYNGQSIEWTMPKTVVRRQYKAVSVGQVLSQIAKLQIQDCTAGKLTTNDEQFLLVPRAANALIDHLSPVLRQLRKATEDEVVRVELPQSVRDELEKDTISPANDMMLGDRPDRVRLHAKHAESFLRQLRSTGAGGSLPDAMIVEGLAAEAVEKVRSALQGIALIVALPAVFFEEDIPAIRRLLGACQGAGAAVEVNNWGGWLLAKEAQLRMESGLGLPVLNSLAARVLGEAGVECVSLSVEADRQQLEEATAHCLLPCSLVVFGRPALLTTRVQLPREQFLNKVFADRRGVRLIPRIEHGLWVFRPAEPFDLRRTTNEHIRVSHLVVDLVGSPDPAEEWRRLPGPMTKPFRFNYSRTLA